MVVRPMARSLLGLVLVLLLVVTLGLALAAGLTAALSPDLTYDVRSAGGNVFAPRGDKTVLVRVENAGPATIEEVDGFVAFRQATLVQASLEAPPGVEARGAQDGNSYRVMVSSLPPGGAFTVTLVVRDAFPAGPFSRDPDPQVSFAGEGVRARHEDALSAAGVLGLSALGGALATSLVLLALVVVGARRRRRLAEAAPHLQTASALEPPAPPT